MTISVIIPAYNCERYIGRCLDSLFSQRGATLDIIVVNAGSTDDTGTVISKYENSIRAVTTENRGTSAARNTGIEMMRGDYVMFLDADDWLAEGAIEKLSGIIADTGADIVKFRYKNFFPDGREFVDKNQFDEYEIIEKKDFKTKIYPFFISGIRLNSICIGIFRAGLIKGRKLREDMRVAEDAVFSIGTYTLAEKIVISPDFLYCYYQTGTGLTGSGAKISEKYKCNFIFASETVKYLKIWDMDSPLMRLKVYLRPMLLTFDKVKRLILSKA